MLRTVITPFRPLLAAVLALIVFCGSPAGAADQEEQPLPRSAVLELSHVAVDLLAAELTDGDTLTIRCRFTNNSSSPVNLSQAAGSDRRLPVFAAIFFMDNVNRKKHLVILDTRKVPLCSTFNGVIKPGESYTGWSKFAAPPPDVKTITVYIPGAEPFDNVPVTH